MTAHAPRTSDPATTGEALGEYGVYSHPRTPHPEIRRVPWCRVGDLTAEGVAAAARARKRFEPADGGVDGDVAGRLDALGYAD